LLRASSRKKRAVSAVKIGFEVIGLRREMCYFSFAAN